MEDELKYMCSDTPASMICVLEDRKNNPRHLKTVPVPELALISNLEMDLSFTTFSFI